MLLFVIKMKETIKMKCGLLTNLALLITLSIISHGADECNSNKIIYAEFVQLERDIPSLYLINGLCLSKEQADKIASILENVNKLETSYTEKTSKIIARHERDVQKESNTILSIRPGALLKQEQKIINPSRVQRLSNARKEINKLRTERQQEIDTLADKVFDILTDSQRTILEKFVPCFIPSRDFKNPERVGQATDNTSFVENLLEKLRNVDQENKELLDDAVDEALDRLVPYVMHKRYIPYSDDVAEKVRAELSKSLIGVLRRIGKLSDADFVLEKTKLAQEVLPLKEKPEGMHALRWKISMYLLNTGIADVIKTRAQSPALSSSTPVSTTLRSECPLDNHRVVRTAFLLHKLDLSKTQASELLTIVRQASECIKQIEKQAIETMQEALPVYKQLKYELTIGTPTQKTENRAGYYHSNVKSLKNETLVNELMKYEKLMDEILSANQVAFLTQQSSGNKDSFVYKEHVEPSLTRAMRTLTDARAMSALEFTRKKEKLAEEFVSEYLENANFEANAVDKLVAIKNAMSVLEKVRGLNDADYNKLRKSLAIELCPKRTSPRPVIYGTQYKKGKPLPELYASTRMIFSETGRELLEELSSFR